MRRKDRERPAEFALAVVDSCAFATLGTVSADGAPYCAAISIARSGDSIYFHTAKSGHKIDNIARQPQVCLSCVGELVVPENEFTVKYDSAVVFGRAERVDDEAERLLAYRLLSERHTPKAMPAFDAEILKSGRAADVYKITIERITGKSNK